MTSHRTVGGVIVYVLKPEPGDSKRVLFMKRAYGDANYPWWPVAGTPLPDETPEATARRELLEETGIVAEHLQPFGREIPHADPDRSLIVYVTEVGVDTQVVLNHEHTAFRWLTGDEAIDVVPEGSRDYLRHLRDRFIL